MDVEELRETLRQLQEKERETTFEAAFAIGEAHGRREQVLDLIKKHEEDRKVVEIGGKPVETASKAPNTEKR